ncbi:MAG: hypothetical protein A3K19_17480 [Lentisphaerae bacterium RIFOXYB12_FULL_65_16]|nr:MAG: hypothetical protein A3K18_12475 [Lentisphaerae bacterium RIFOXYA12_64_32]OGV85592.1 MAG: hypothetical protein A3K19_17480 [Lentisphaerae bacterium RIFOXYB12_FULL_65_16]
MPETTPTPFEELGKPRLPGAPPDPYSPRGFPQAQRTLMPWQRYALIGAVVLLAAAAFVSWRIELLVINIVLSVFYLVTTVYRYWLIDLSMRQARDLRFTPEQLAHPPAAAEQWPTYVVLVPLYHEADVLPRLVAGLSRLDYPKDRLEIRLLVEADDDETMAAARALDLRPPFVIWPIPVSQPRTKPKACNVGLQNCNAQLLVIYDAEDQPEPDQLKKAAWAFASVSRHVACIQAKLNFYNSRRNFLTRCFTAEYATWFDLCLPGLDRLQAPIPLGGTSNHFRVAVLKDLGGWDEFNVTEDCDLGIRLFAEGWQTRILDSTTWEQACPDLRYWIRQRSRWVKGYIQTYLIHNRAPLRLLRRMGFTHALHFHLLVGGTPLCQLISPLYWFLAVLWLVARPQGLSEFFPGPIFAMGALCLFVGNFIFAYTAAIACVRRGFGDLAKHGLLMPIYWVLMSLGAWRGLVQLLLNPHHWDKTAHFADPQATASG